MEPESNAATLLATAFAAHQSGRISEAEALYQRVLAADPAHADALHLLGLLLFERGDHEEGVRLVDRALAVDPSNGDAWNNLGNLLCDRDPARAEACFRRVLSIDPDAIAAHGNLATLLMARGDHAGATAELRAILGLAPEDRAALRLLAKCLRALRDFEGSIAVGERALAFAPADAALRKAISHCYFLWFDSVDRDRTQAERVITAWRTFDPSDPVAAHMHSALFDTDIPQRASDAYVERHFDEFAPQFDEVLKTLQYRAPGAVVDRVRQVLEPRDGSLDVVDLGCGTGLVGALARDFAKRLVGVDLSGKMLDEAGARGVYDELCRDEVTSFLEHHADSFDLALSADMFIYFGALERLLGAASGALRRGGHFVFTAERLEDRPGGRPFHLHAAGRYAHTQRYVEEVLASSGFVLRSIQDDVLRVEYGQPVMGLLVVARRP